VLSSWTLVPQEFLPPLLKAACLHTTLAALMSPNTLALFGMQQFGASLIPPAPPPLEIAISQLPNVGHVPDRTVSDEPAW